MVLRAEARRDQDAFGRANVSIEGSSNAGSRDTPSTLSCSASGVPARAARVRYTSTSSAKSLVCLPWLAGLPGTLIIRGTLVASSKLVCKGVGRKDGGGSWEGCHGLNGAHHLSKHAEVTKSELGAAPAAPRLLRFHLFVEVIVFSKLPPMISCGEATVVNTQTATAHLDADTGTKYRFRTDLMPSIHFPKLCVNTFAERMRFSPCSSTIVVSAFPRLSSSLITRPTWWSCGRGRTIGQQGRSARALARQAAVTSRKRALVVANSRMRV